MKPSRKIAVFVAITIVWIALDRWTKSLFDGVEPGVLFGSMPGGLIDFRLVHNTGAAWGLFAGNTLALGIFSLVVVVVLVGFFALNVKSVNLVQVIGIALVAAGGIGNAIDRFAQGYVTDFIATTFIDFPVFNVADIGVTCGVAIIFIGLIVQWITESREEDQVPE